MYNCCDSADNEELLNERLKL
jgi:chromosome segregation ATPase